MVEVLSQQQIKLGQVSLLHQPINRTYLSQCEVKWTVMKSEFQWHELEQSGVEVSKVKWSEVKIKEFLFKLTHFEVNVAALMLKNVALDWCDTALACNIHETLISTSMMSRTIC